MMDSLSACADVGSVISHGSSISSQSVQGASAISDDDDSDSDDDSSGNLSLQSYQEDLSPGGMVRAAAEEFLAGLELEDEDVSTSYHD
jgi:hypothetical protein